MGTTIKIRRGTKANLPALQDGEPGWVSDEKTLYIGQDGDSILVGGRTGGIDALDYSTLEAADTAAAAAGKQLIVSSNWTLTANTVLTASVKVLPGGSFTKASTYTLTINGPFESGLYQVFSGFDAGDVTFGGGAVEKIPTSWFATNTTPGTTDMSTAFHSAVHAATDGDTISFPNESYNLASTVIVDKAVKIQLNGVQIIGPASGYAIDVTSNDVQIEGSGDANITLTEGCDGGIRLNNVMRPKVSKLKMDMNDVTNAIGLHQYGCWYANVKDIWIEKAKTHATSKGIVVESHFDFAGAPGTNGTYGGSYVSTYKNCVARVVHLKGYLNGADSSPNTTLTFTMMDMERVIIEHTGMISFILPVVQGTAGTFWDLDTTSNITVIAGDFEGTGTTIYKFTGSNRGFKAFGNQISGVGNIYLSGYPTASSYFQDDAETLGAGGLTGLIQGYVGALQPLAFQNSATDTISRVGYHYDGSKFQISNNLTAIDATTANLDDIAQGGVLFTMTTSGTWEMSVADSGANPRTLIKMLSGDTTGITNTRSIYPLTDNTYYLGKNDDDTPFAWKGVILKDTTNGKYYRIEVINGVVTATDLTD